MKYHYSDQHEVDHAPLVGNPLSAVFAIAVIIGIVAFSIGTLLRFL